MSSGTGSSNDGFANSGTANTLATTYGSRATANSNILTPTLNRMATNPQGYDQSQLNGFNTAATQSIGGATAGAVGGANQTAARTNNAGGYAPAVAQVAHDGTAALSDAALNVQNQNAQLKQQQQAEGISGLEGMYNTNTGADENALSLSNQALNVVNGAKVPFWQKYILNGQTAAAKAGEGAGA